MAISSLFKRLNATAAILSLSLVGVFGAAAQTYASSPPAITTTALPHAQVSIAYSQAIGMVGGTSPYTWTVTAGALPAGLSLGYYNGVISGTPTTRATSSFTVQVKDSVSRSATQGLSITVDAAPPTYAPGTPIGTIPTSPYTVSDATLPSGTVGSAYASDLTGGGGVLPYSWVLDVGASLPAGLSLTTVDSVGQVRGTPTVSGTYSFSVKMTDARDRAAYKTFNVTINPSVTFTPGTTPVLTIDPSITTVSVSAGTVGTSYGSTLYATGGVAPYHWNFASGTLPSGLSLTTDGVITGTPTSAGTYTAYIEVFDSRGRFSGRTFTFSIAAAATTGSGGGSGGGSTIIATDLMNRLNNLSRIGVSVHALVKLPDDGNRFTQEDSAVYYIGADGRRHAFPSDRVYFTWYGNFGGVRVISASDMASLPLGANATYHPGVKMVKFMTDPKVYAVSSDHTLRWVKTEGAAQALYGSNWNHSIDDISDTFYGDYAFGAEINTSADFSPSTVRGLVSHVSDVLPL